MNTVEVAKLTGIPVELLIRMRNRTLQMFSYRCGPPFCQVFDKTKMKFVYERDKVKTWMKFRNCLITAGDAALLKGVRREAIMTLSGVKSFEIRRKGCVGKLVIDNGHSIYLWVPRKS